jgi:hypothetical protein
MITYLQIKQEFQRSRTYYKSKLIIWDEVPLIQTYRLLSLNLLLRDLISNGTISGEKVGA